MSETGDDLISSLYPPPPPYYKFFTEANLEKLSEWNSTNAEVATDGEKDDVKQQPNKRPPGKLKFLVPPEKPEGTHYRGFGNFWSFEDKLPSLKELGWQQLYKDDDEEITSKTKIQELHKLMHSLLLNFLELVGVVSIEPQQFHYKIEDLKLILININHILNTYRPHQSRESLIMLLKKQIEKKRNEIKEIDEVSKEVKSKILSLVNIENMTQGITEETKQADNDENEIDTAVRKLLNEN